MQPVSPSDTRVSAAPSSEEIAVFPVISGYRFQKRLGQGGMATVYLATQVSLDRPVSIKVMERDALLDETSMQRFENEAHTIAKLTHPSIVNIYEVGRTSDGRMYYIMPYLPNGDLSQRDLRNDETRILEVLRTLLSALGYAHARGIVHRDVKEENVLFDAADRPLLTDFGIALSKRDTSRITTAGLAVGSSGYMAPEQARGDVVDGRADLYSVGVLAYELLNGGLPFQSPDALALALMHAQKPVPRLPPAKRHWQAFIDRAMAKSPENRFRDAQQMLSALERIGSRTGDHFTGRLLRGFDHAIREKVWKQPGVLALAGVLLIAIGLYSARKQLPHFGASAGSAQAQSTAPIVPPKSAPSASAVASIPKPAIKPPQSTAVDKPNPASITAASTAPIATQSPLAAPAAIATTPTAASAPITPDAAVLGAARDALVHQNLTSPADNNALDLTRMAWKLSPSTPATKQLVADVLTALSKQQALAIVQHHDARAIDYQKKAQDLADATIGRTDSVFRTLRTAAAAAFDKRVQAETDASDNAALKRTEALARQLDLADTYARAVATAQQKAKLKASTVAANATVDVGAGFVLLHGGTGALPAVALARTEVTRHEYAEFVNATHRRAAACADTQAQTGTHKNWTLPGFAQTSAQPVVCVSWEDANAYAQWLSSRSGQRYRLPSFADWHEASVAANAAGQTGVTGSFSGWLQNCTAGCQRHLVAGRSWHGRETAPVGRAGDRGFDDVGFRVVRELGGRR